MIKKKYLKSIVNFSYNFSTVNYLNGYFDFVAVIFLVVLAMFSGCSDNKGEKDADGDVIYIPEDSMDTESKDVISDDSVEIINDNIEIRNDEQLEEDIQGNEGDAGIIDEGDSLGDIIFDDAGSDDGVSEEPQCECIVDEDCFNDNPCVVRMCSPIDCQCYDFPLGEGMPCDDGLFCNGSDYCAGGVCTPGDPPCGDSANPCKRVSCNEVTDSCEEIPLPNGTSCDDGLWCTGTDTCYDGSCRHEYPCPITTDNPCTHADCDEAGRRCIEEQLPDGTSCSDDNICTFFATCQGGICVQRETACQDDIPCSVDRCAINAEGRCVLVSICP